MADTQSILQLGIEAARAGDKDEARNLFRLLTRETPNDPDAWLWLAGVAEDREEKRAALEQVTRLDPSNALARQGLAALGGPSAVAIAPAPLPPTPAAEDEFDFNTFEAVETPAPAQPASREIGPARELSPDEEFAMSLDSLGSMSTQYNARTSGSSSDKDLLDFDIPDFGEDDLDLDAYMNRERVDASSIEIVPDAPKKKPGKGKPPKLPRAEGDTSSRRASGGLMPLIIGGLGVAVIAALFFLWTRGDSSAPVVGQATPTRGAGGVPTTNAPGGGGDPTLPPLAGQTAVPPVEGQTTVPPVEGQTTVPPVEGQTAVPPVEGQATTPPQQPQGNPPVDTDPALVQAQPQQLNANGYNPIFVNDWYFNYGGVSAVVAGPIGPVQPVGRWLVIVPLMFNATGQDQPLPGDLLVVKDAQGRVYRPNADASEAYFNANPGSYNIHQKQNAPQGFNFAMPLVFDVANDATDLVLFSRSKTDQGYLVRSNVQ